MLKVRDDRMSVVYAYFEGQHAPSIAAAVVYHALAMDVCALSIYDERLVESVSALRCPYWSAKKVARGFLLSKVLADISSTDCRLHGGDGDFVFY